nr:acyl-n-acyltransferase [Melanopsichium pennsylvanicum 4]
MPCLEESEYTVTLCTSGKQLRSCCDVRISVFVNEQGFALQDEMDQYDPLAAHFMLAHNSNPDRAIGTLRLLPYPLPIPKPDEQGGEPDIHSSYPLGGSRSESAIAADFISAAWTKFPKPVGRGRDPAQTEEEESKTEEIMLEKGGAKLGRLALLKEARGKGLGHLLVRKAESWLMSILGSDEASRHGAFGPRPSIQNGKEKGQASDCDKTKAERLESIIIKLSSQIYVIDFYNK